MALRLAFAGGERLWKVWWLWGIPMALAVGALTAGAELLREAGHHTSGALLDVAKILVYAAWFIAAWRCARNAGHPAWKDVSRTVAALGLVLVAITA